jgi:hypothetical protein
MDTRRKNDARGRRWPSLLLGMLFLGTLLLNTGCINPASLEFLFMPWKDNKEQPKMPLVTDKKKETTVVILASFANPLEARPEFQTVDQELCVKLTQKLEERYKDNKEKVKIIPYYKVKSYLNKELDPTLLAKRDVGKHFKANYVINLEINSMSFYEGSYRQLFRGHTEISVTVFDMSKEAEEGPVYDDIYQTDYPNHGPIDAGNESVLSFRTAFIGRLARDLSRYFAAYPADERLDMR